MKIYIYMSLPAIKFCYVCNTRRQNKLLQVDLVQNNKKNNQRVIDIVRNCKDGNVDEIIAKKWLRGSQPYFLN